MGAELGRISGPLLAENLLRRGTDLAFETQLLYLDVTNGRIGIHTSSPTNELQVVGTARTTNVTVDTQATLASLTLFNNSIQNTIGGIIISPNQSVDPTVVINTLQIL
jgi:hypothetical protein